MHLKEVLGRRRTIRFFLPFRPVAGAKMALMHNAGIGGVYLIAFKR